MSSNLVSSASYHSQQQRPLADLNSPGQDECNAFFIQFKERFAFKVKGSEEVLLLLDALIKNDYKEAIRLTDLLSIDAISLLALPFVDHLLKKLENSLKENISLNAISCFLNLFCLLKTFNIKMQGLTIISSEQFERAMALLRRDIFFETTNLNDITTLCRVLVESIKDLGDDHSELVRIFTDLFIKRLLQNVKNHLEEEDQTLGSTNNFLHFFVHLKEKSLLSDAEFEDIVLTLLNTPLKFNSIQIEKNLRDLAQRFEILESLKDLGEDLPSLPPLYYKLAYHILLSALRIPKNKQSFTDFLIILSKCLDSGREQEEFQTIANTCLIQEIRRNDGLHIRLLTIHLWDNIEFLKIALPRLTRIIDMLLDYSLEFPLIPDFLINAHNLILRVKQYNFEFKKDYANSLAKFVIKAIAKNKANKVPLENLLKEAAALRDVLRQQIRDNLPTAETERKLDELDQQKEKLRFVKWQSTLKLLIQLKYIKQSLLHERESKIVTTLLYQVIGSELALFDELSSEDDLSDSEIPQLKVSWGKNIEVETEKEDYDDEGDFSEESEITPRKELASAKVEEVNQENEAVFERLLTFLNSNEREALREDPAPIIVEEVAQEKEVANKLEKEKSEEELVQSILQGESENLDEPSIDDKIQSFLNNSNIEKLEELIRYFDIEKEIIPEDRLLQFLKCCSLAFSKTDLFFRGCILLSFVKEQNLFNEIPHKEINKVCVELVNHFPHEVMLLSNDDVIGVLEYCLTRLDQPEQFLPIIALGKKFRLIDLLHKTWVAISNRKFNDSSLLESIIKDLDPKSLRQIIQWKKLEEVESLDLTEKLIEEGQEGVADLKNLLDKVSTRKKLKFMTQMGQRIAKLNGQCPDQYVAIAYEFYQQIKQTVSEQDDLYKTATFEIIKILLLTQDGLIRGWDLLKKPNIIPSIPVALRQQFQSRLREKIQLLLDNPDAEKMEEVIHHFDILKELATKEMAVNLLQGISLSFQHTGLFERGCILLLFMQQHHFFNAIPEDAIRKVCTELVATFPEDWMLLSNNEVMRAFDFALTQLDQPQHFLPAIALGKKFKSLDLLHRIWVKICNLKDEKDLLFRKMIDEMDLKELQQVAEWKEIGEEESLILVEKFIEENKTIPIFAPFLEKAFKAPAQRKLDFIRKLCKRIIQLGDLCSENNFDVLSHCVSTIQQEVSNHDLLTFEVAKAFLQSPHPIHTHNAHTAIYRFLSKSKNPMIPEDLFKELLSKLELEKVGALNRIITLQGLNPQRENRIAALEIILKMVKSKTPSLADLDLLSYNLVQYADDDIKGMNILPIVVCVLDALEKFRAISLKTHPQQRLLQFNFLPIQYALTVKRLLVKFQPYLERSYNPKLAPHATVEKFLKFKAEADELKKAKKPDHLEILKRENYLKQQLKHYLHNTLYDLPWFSPYLKTHISYVSIFGVHQPFWDLLCEYEMDHFIKALDYADALDYYIDENFAGFEKITPLKWRLHIEEYVLAKLTLNYSHTKLLLKRFKIFVNITEKLQSAPSVANGFYINSIRDSGSAIGFLPFAENSPESVADFYAEFNRLLLILRKKDPACNEQFCVDQKYNFLKSLYAIFMVFSFIRPLLDNKEFKDNLKAAASEDDFAKLHQKHLPELLQYLSKQQGVVFEKNKVSIVFKYILQNKNLMLTDKFMQGNLQRIFFSCALPILKDLEKEKLNADQLAFIHAIGFKKGLI